MIISFSDRETGTKLLRLEFNKKTKLVKYRNKWIKPKIIYNKGYQDANVKKKCQDCSKPLLNYKWQCDKCKQRTNSILSKLIGEVNEVLK